MIIDIILLVATAILMITVEVMRKQINDLVDVSIEQTNLIRHLGGRIKYLEILEKQKEINK